MKIGASGFQFAASIILPDELDHGDDNASESRSNLEPVADSTHVS